MTVHTELPAEAVAKLIAARFVIAADDAGWIAEYTAGRHRVRVEEAGDGWFVSQVRIAGSFERVKTAAHHADLADAAAAALQLVAELNARLRLVGSVAGPLWAELRRTS